MPAASIRCTSSWNRVKARASGVSLPLMATTGSGMRKSARPRTSSRLTLGKRKTKIDPSTAELLRRDPTLRKLAERITYYEERFREEREARGEDTSNDRPFLSLSPEEQSELAQRKLRERIAYHEAKLAEERGEDAASAGQ